MPIADLIAGMNGAYGVLAALYERSTTGRGRVVRTSLLAGMVGVHAFQGTRWTVAGEVPGLNGNHHAAIAPYGLFRTASSPIQVACGTETLWKAFAAAVGLDAADGRFATNASRVAHRDALIDGIEAIFATEPAEHWLPLIDAARVPCGKVRTIDDVYRWEQTLSQGLLIETGGLELPGPPLRFDDNAYAGGRETHLPPPRLGQHNDAIRTWLAEQD